MLMFFKCVILGLCLTVSIVFAQQGERVDLGRLQSGATVSFVHAAGGEWGIEISGGTIPKITQEKPLYIELFRGQDNVQQVANGYQSVQKENDMVTARAKVTAGGNAAFDIEDQWKVSGDVLSLNRKVSVSGTEENTGFFSSIRFLTEPSVKWEQLNCFVPGLLYADPSHAGGGVPTSTSNYQAKHLSIREDYLSAPLIAFSMQNGSWVAILDMAPKGDTTQEETTASAAATIIDERIQFGALGAQELSSGGIEFGFCLPGTTSELGGRGGSGGMTRGAGGATRGMTRGTGGATRGTGIEGAARGMARGTDGAVRGGAGEAVSVTVRRRYHPVKAGFAQSYQVGFRFGKSESFRDMERESWRWAWESLNPKVTPIDTDTARIALMDHLADRVVTVDDRAGIPYQANTLTGRSNSTKIQMSFCGKNIEAANQLLLEGDRDKTERGQRMRKLGLVIINSFIRIVPMSPPGGSGFDIQTGQAITGNPGSMYLRAGSEDMPFLLDAYQREKKAGQDHPEWLQWVKSLGDWLLEQQRQDGSWPQVWQTGTTTVRQESGATTYAPIPMMVKLSEVTGDKKYLDSAIKASEYLWTNYGNKCVYCGATGNANVADKESGMLSLEAFLAAYEGTKDSKWLERAESAASYAESWIWIWNVPMPVDADNATLHWKKGVSTIGVNGIGSDVAGHVDQFFAWSVPSYARLYKYTNDKHYLDVAYVLLHGTKAMLALPGRTYDMLGPGWQQEHWRMGPETRGMGAHRDWLPWVSINHIHGIIGLEEFDKNLYNKLAGEN
jgi:hypothetical protein